MISKYGIKKLRSQRYFKKKILRINEHCLNILLLFIIFFILFHLIFISILSKIVYFTFIFSDFSHTFCYW